MDKVVESYKKYLNELNNLGDNITSEQKKEKNEYEIKILHFEYCDCNLKRMIDFETDMVYFVNNFSNNRRYEVDENKQKDIFYLKEIRNQKHVIITKSSRIFDHFNDVIPEILRDLSSKIKRTDAALLLTEIEFNNAYREISDLLLKVNLGDFSSFENNIYKIYRKNFMELVLLIDNCINLMAEECEVESKKYQEYINFSKYIIDKCYKLDNYIKDEFLERVKEKNRKIPRYVSNFDYLRTKIKEMVDIKDDINKLSIPITFKNRDI